jgi:hypothetical protein
MARQDRVSALVVGHEDENIRRHIVLRELNQDGGFTPPS